MLLHLFCLLSLFLTFIDNGSAGITSAYIRTQFPSVDIPLDNEVVSVPKGYNAPQQVSFRLFDLLFVGSVKAFLTCDLFIYSPFS